jgi:putative FmdB family regulatory protein
MPLYDYECETCGIRFERKQRITDQPLKLCPECSGPVHRLIQPVGIIFKGSGFYCTDHRGGSSATVGAPAKPADKSEPSTSSTEKKDKASSSDS